MPHVKRVIFGTEDIGAGSKKSPYRIREVVWGFNGEVLATSDPCSFNIETIYSALQEHGVPEEKIKEIIKTIQESFAPFRLVLNNA
jgi:hypothetical protein